MTLQLKQFNIEEARYIMLRILKNNMYTAEDMDVVQYKNGLVATHEKLTIHALNKDTKQWEKDVTVHVKIMPKERVYIANFSIGESIFWKEVNFYETVLPCILYKYRTHKFMPNCIMTTGARLVFEDLTTQDYQKHDIFDKYELVKKVLASLARLHCSSIVAEALLTYRYNKKKTMLEKFPTSFDEMMFEPQWSTIGKWYRVGIELACKLAQRIFKNEIVELREALLCVHDLVKVSGKHCNVICHGDLRKDNMMFQIKNNGEIRCLFLNFYLVRYAPFALEILQVLYLHTSREFRDEQEQELLEYYHYKMNDAAHEYERLPKDVDIPLLSLEDIEVAMKDLRLFGPAVASVYLSLSLVDETRVTAFIREPVPPDVFLVKEVVNVIYSRLNANKRLKQQLSDLLLECLDIYRETVAQARANPVI